MLGGKLFLLLINYSCRPGRSSRDSVSKPVFLMWVRSSSWCESGESPYLCPRGIGSGRKTTEAGEKSSEKDETGLRVIGKVRFLE